MKSSKQLPSVTDVRKTMRRLSLVLYDAWKRELRDRILNLEFDGYIAKDHINVPSAVWRLPNSEITYALNRLKRDLQELGYDYEFKFDDVDDVTFIVLYVISLPETTEDEDESLFNTEDFEENLDESSSNVGNEYDNEDGETSYDDRHVHVKAASTDHVQIDSLKPGFVIDGITLDEKDHVLLKDQRNLTNGLYFISKDGSMYDHATTVEICTIHVNCGDVNVNKCFICTSHYPTTYLETTASNDTHTRASADENKDS